MFQHGFSSNLESWYDAGYGHALQHDYQLILIDARGHGASDTPHDPEAYALQRRVGDIVTVLDHLHIAKAHFFGDSMGGWIGFGLAQYAPERFHALIIGGSHPYARRMDDQRQALRKGIEQGREAYVAALEALDGPLSPRRKARALAADLEALLAASQDRPSLEAVLPTMSMPCLLFAGEAAPLYPVVREWVKQRPNVTFFSLPDLGHGEARARSDLVLPPITKFLATMPCCCTAGRGKIKERRDDSRYATPHEGMQPRRTASAPMSLPLPAAADTCRLATS